MSLTLENVLSWHYLTETVRVVQPGVPDVFPSQFYTLKKKVLGNRAEYIQLYGTRKLAQRVPYGAPLRLIPKTVLTYRNVELISIGNRMVFDQEFQQFLRKFDEWEEQRDRCLDLVAEQGGQFAMRFENTRRTSLGIFLATGKNWFDESGNMLPTASGATLTIDQGVPAANTGAVTDSYSAGGYVVNSSWALPTTDVVSQINNLKTVARKASGYPLQYAFYGRQVAGNLSKNETVKAYWQLNLPHGEQVLKEGKVPDGFMGLKWVPAQDAFYDTEAGTSTEYWPANQATFFPDVTANTYAMWEGTKMVPNLFNTHADGVAVLKDSKEVQGMGRMAYWDVNSRVIVDEGFDTFMPLFKVPASVFIVNTAS